MTESRDHEQTMNSSDAPSLRESPKPRVPNVGDWFVYKSTYSFYVEGPITAVTAQQVRFLTHPSASQGRRCDLSSVVFAGAEKDCRDLYSIICGSVQRLEAARRDASEAHKLRIEKAVVLVSNRKDGASPKTLQPPHSNGGGEP